MPQDVTFTRLDTQALFDLKGPARPLRDWAGDALPAFPDRPNSKTEAEGATLLFIGSDHWLLRADLAAEAALNTALRPAEAPPEISVTLVSDTLAFFRVTGPGAADILAIACPLDLHDSRFGNDAATWTDTFGLKALVTRCAGGFDVAVDQSFAPMMVDCLTRAAR